MRLSIFDFRFPIKKPCATAVSAVAPALCFAFLLAPIAVGADDLNLPPPENRTATADEAAAALSKAIAFMLKDQNADGSWGGPRGAIWTFTGDVWNNPETHRSWKAATTGLGALCLLKTIPPDSSAITHNTAAEKAVDWLIEHADVKRPSDWDTMNTWAYIYGIQAFAVAYNHPLFVDSPKRPQIKAAAERLAKNLGIAQTPVGGWGYLEFDPPRTPRQQWSTSFTTAAGVVALVEAQKCGFEVDAAMVQRAARAVKHCKLPTGAYTYSVPVIADPRGLEWIDQIKGSLGRIQVANEAQLMAGGEISLETMRKGLTYFFREHRFLDIARNRPIPHEAYYLNSGYFYLFGHYYAARVIKRLPPEDQALCWPRLRHELLKIQQADGSLYDYDMHAYHKPYGTAFAILALSEATGP